MEKSSDSIAKLKLIQGSTIPSNLSIIEGNKITNNTLSSVTNRSLDQGTSTLESSRILVADTGKVGEMIILDLESQREKLLGAQGNVQTMQSSTATAKRVLSSMSRLTLTLKVFLVFVNFLLFCLIGMLAYYGWEQKKIS